MDADLLSEPSSTLSLGVNDEEQSESATVGLHVLTAESINGTDTIIGQLNEESSSSAIAIPTLPSEIASSDIDKDGEITLQSSLIPENAVLMETPRGLMLTVPETMTYEDITNSNDSTNRPLLSCIPVSFFKTCDVNGEADTSMVYDDVSVEAETNYLQQDINVESCVIAQVQKDGSDDDGNVQTPVLDTLTTLQHNDNHDQEKQTAEAQEVIVQEPIPKRKGGWPKGKKRKVEPVVTGPRAPVTGYVLYAVERRKVIKENHPEISFTEVTKILGQEWSSMPSEEKEKYLAAAEKDKKRYKEELKAFRSSETYQETMRKKLLLQAGVTSPNGISAEALAALEDDENSNELHCKVCNCYFSSGHNKREHMYGKTHLQNVTVTVEKELLRQQREEQGFIDGALIVSEDGSQDGIGTSTCKKTSTERSGPVDIHGFMMEFIQKNYEREQEISILRRNLNKSLQDNLIMCKTIQELQDYQSKLQEELKSLTSTTTSLIVQSDALKTVPTLFGIINL